MPGLKSSARWKQALKTAKSRAPFTGRLVSARGFIVGATSVQVVRSNWQAKPTSAKRGTLGGGRLRQIRNDALKRRDAVLATDVVDALRPQREPVDEHQRP